MEPVDKKTLFAQPFQAVRETAVMYYGDSVSKVGFGDSNFGDFEPYTLSGLSIYFIPQSQITEVL